MSKAKTTPPVLTFKVEDTTFKIYALNPGEQIPKFYPGGQSLMVRDTASLVVLRSDPTDGTHNIEYSLRNRDFWGWIARLINGGTGVKAVGAEPAIEIKDAFNDGRIEMDEAIGRLKP